MKFYTVSLFSDQRCHTLTVNVRKFYINCKYFIQLDINWHEWYVPIDWLMGSWSWLLLYWYGKKWRWRLQTGAALGGWGYRPPNVWSASTIFSELIWSARQTDAHAAYPYKRCGLQPADPFRLVIPGWRYWDLWPTATILSDVCRINWLNWI